MAERGRGADDNPLNRFDRFQVETDEDAWIDDDPRPLKTTFLGDDSQSILTKNESEDLSFAYGLNAYRGCEHGCAVLLRSDRPRVSRAWERGSTSRRRSSSSAMRPRCCKALSKKTYQPGSEVIVRCDGLLPAGRAAS